MKLINNFLCGVQVASLAERGLHGLSVVDSIKRKRSLCAKRVLRVVRCLELFRQGWSATITQ